MAISLGKHLHEIDALPYAELMRWMRFYAIEPFGLIRDDMRTAIVAAAAVQPHMAKGKSAKVSDYMPKFKRPQAKQSRADFELKARMLAQLIKQRTPRMEAS